jgi:hypothetical protein
LFGFFCLSQKQVKQQYYRQKIPFGSWSTIRLFVVGEGSSMSEFSSGRVIQGHEPKGVPKPGENA